MAKGDVLLKKLEKLVSTYDKISVSFIQRVLGVPYAQAEGLMNLLEKRGVIGPADGFNPREVLINKKKK